MNFGDESLPSRFWSKVIPEPNSGCWIWLATTNQDGYGRYWHGMRLASSHRVTYITLNRKLPEGTELDHKCRNRAYCNPKHLQPVTHATNVLIGDAGKHHLQKTHCPNGHEYKGDNLIYRQKARACRQCERDKVKRHRLKRLGKT